MKTKDEYKLTLLCCNCRQYLKVKIPKGKSYEEFIEETKMECWNCGCQRWIN